MSWPPSPNGERKTAEAGSIQRSTVGIDPPPTSHTSLSGLARGRAVPIDRDCRCGESSCFPPNLKSMELSFAEKDGGRGARK